MKRVSQMVVVALVMWMRDCRDDGEISFYACLAEARKQFAREVREEALNSGTPKAN